MDNNLITRTLNIIMVKNKRSSGPFHDRHCWFTMLLPELESFVQTDIQ